jgi:ABC-type lipoprotein export system ATPase subunit
MASGDFQALKGVTLDIIEGEFLGIIGKSGAGKTTLLNMISGISEITKGEVVFYPRGNNGDRMNNLVFHINSMDEDEMALWRGENIGIVYQSFELMPMLDLVNNVMLPQDFTGAYNPRISHQRALELLEMVGLLEHAYKKPAHISGGQKQRVAIARALVNDPPVVLADEPTGNLDSVTAETIFQVFEKLVDQGKTIVMVTHDENLATRFSRQVQVSDGEIVSNEVNGKGRKKKREKEKHLLERIVKRVSTTISKLVSKGDGREFSEEEAGKPVSLEPLASQGIRRRSRGNGSERPAILLQDVVKTFENAAGKFTALKGVNLHLDYGQFISLVGKSGSGKSTLLNMVTGIDYPTSGEVFVGGENIYQMTESQRAFWRGRNIGIVFQFFQLLPTLTLLENTMLPMDYTNVYRISERPKRAMELLRMVGLEDQANMLPASVSNGQQQSAAIARALATDPPIIVADEPTGNLDSKAATIVIRLFEALAERGKTILIVTHDPTLTRQTDQTLVISDGMIVEENVGQVLPLLNHPQVYRATRRAEKRIYQPGETIIQYGNPVEYFYIITRGEVDILLGHPKCPDEPLVRLGHGKVFGEVELLQGGNAIATARAGLDKPVEVAVLTKDQFCQMLKESPPVEDVLNSMAVKHREENRLKNEECVKI